MSDTTEPTAPSVDKFPVQIPYQRPHPGFPRHVPWWMVEPHERQANVNHCGQTLKRLAERGGLSPTELVAVLADREWVNLTDADCLIAFRNLRVPAMLTHIDRQAERITKLARLLDLQMPDPNNCSDCLDTPIGSSPNDLCEAHEALEPYRQLAQGMCKHGEEGAASDPSICSACVHESSPG